jgi:hypothetical protein
MITVITGLTGSGKTWLMTRLMYEDWKRGSAIFANFPLHFKKKNVEENEDVTRWHNLDELYALNHGVIAIDEGQKLFDARRWGSLPVSFAEKIAQHRKHYLDIYTTTQDLGHIDVRVRTNIHELFACQSLLRLPKNDRVKPWFQIIKVTKKKRVITSDTDRIAWQKIKSKWHFVSRFWTRELYDTYGDIGFEKYLCKIKYDKKKWIAKIYARDLINQGKARL